MAQLQSDDAKRYMREHLLEAFDEVATADPTVVKTTALTQQEMLHEVNRSIPGLSMQGLVERASDRESGDCNELLNGKSGALYRGCQRELRWAFRASCGLHRRQIATLAQLIISQLMV